MSERVPSEPEDILGPSISADALFHGWEWPQPCTPAEFTQVSEFFRDRVLVPVRVEIEQRLGFDHLISIDGEDQTKPIQMRWQTQLAPTASWSNRWGVVCQGIRLTEIFEGSERPIGMVQIGGTFVSGEEFQHLPRGAFVQEFFQARTSRYYLLLLETYFATRWSIENYEPTLLDSIGELEALWHRVPEREDWLRIVDVMGRTIRRRHDGPSS